MTPLLLQSEASAECQAPSPWPTLGKALQKQKRLILESKKWLEMTIQHGGGGRRISTNYKAGDQEEEKHEESHFEEELKPICEVGWVTVRTNNHQTVSLMLTRGWRELLKCVSASQWQWKGWTMLQPVTAWESGGAVKRLNIRLVGRHYSSVVVRVGGGWEVGGGGRSRSVSWTPQQCTSHVNVSQTSPSAAHTRANAAID